MAILEKTQFVKGDRVQGEAGARLASWEGMLILLCCVVSPCNPAKYLVLASPQAAASQRGGNKSQLY